MTISEDVGSEKMSTLTRLSPNSSPKIKKKKERKEKKLEKMTGSKMLMKLNNTS